jgi:hypothetical protein
MVFANLADNNGDENNDIDINYDILKSVGHH